MSEYPIEGLMNTAMNSIREMIDVDTIIGEPIETSNDIVIIPVSKVNFGFAAGGSEFKPKTNNTSKENNQEREDYKAGRMPFGGGAGAGVSINPIAFIVVQPSGVKLLPVAHSSSLDKLLDLVPDLIDKTAQMIDKQLKKMDKNKNLEENIIVKVSSDDNNYQESNKSKKKSTSKSKIDNSEEPSKVVKIESKPYDIEYDETDM